ncbi:MAG: hypothetical protein U0736_18525 [Gemmataceae bacterium]
MNSTAANWLRPAFEAIAELPLTQGKLSAGGVERFVTDWRHAGIACRLAYEWLIERCRPLRSSPSWYARRPRQRASQTPSSVIGWRKSRRRRTTAPPASRYRQALAGACDPDHVEPRPRACWKSWKRES